ncbi:hypothetical protein J416_01409 [Gracilibacillus halophilus YIM-C55.5]|uniref:Sporulation integral membrane protein YtvI n=1 Tax=Gracilibacillus halophilus YIM-C55.5 TaxID=1308866 RepID=N4WDK3_9BACI|nr:sporulation integral membrane protein YtvI [Gracilibacillus halophilus]ENH98353.1 hypothetical protein J416_01409 [Gracilibacillus halophilus YIM-C55.5]
MFKHITKRQWKLIILIPIILVIAYFVLPVSIPIIIALLTALMLNPIVRLFINRLRFNRKIAVTTVFLLFIIVLSTIGTYAVTKVVSQIIALTENFPSYVIQFNQQLLQWETQIDHFTSDIPDEVMTQVKNTIQDSLWQFGTSLQDSFEIDRIAGIVSKIPDYIVSLLVYLIALFMFMLELPRLKAKVYSYLTEQTAEKVKFMNGRLSYVIFGFLKAQFLVSIIIFIVTLIGLLLFVPEYALIMSLLIWLIDFIPIIGSIAILGPWSLYLLITGDYVLGLQLAILAIILLAIRRTVEPKVMGAHIGLSPLATLIAMYVGLKLLGILGFIIGPIIVIAFNSAKEAGIIKLNIKI